MNFRKRLRIDRPFSVVLVERDMEDLTELIVGVVDIKVKLEHFCGAQPPRIQVIKMV